MKNKYNNNIINAVKKITNIINKPIDNKKFAFLFGSGINNNIAQTKNLDWNNFSKKIISEFLDSKDEELKSRSKWEKNILLKQISKEIKENKVSCSFLNKKTKLEINSKSKKNNNWFQKGFDLIEEKFSHGVIVMTLNYDRVISQNLKEREARNFLLYPSIKAKKEILHLHGLVDEKNYIHEGEGILTLEDYAKNSSKVEKKFLDFLFGNVKNNDNLKNDFDFTLLIIGASLKEQHLLNAIYKFREECKKNNVTNIKIFLIVHNNWNDFIFEKYKNIYQKINIEIINIDSGNGKSYEEDFKTFWKDLENNIEKNDFNFDQVIFKKNDVFLDNDLYKILKNKFKDQKNVSIHQILNYVKPKFKLKNLLIRPIYWLEKRDRIVNKETLKRYILMQDSSNQLDEIPINQIHWIEIEKFSKEEINLIFEILENNLKNKDYFLNYEIEQFISTHYKKIDFQKYKNIHIFLISKILRKGFTREIQEYILDKTYFSNDLIEYLNKSLYSLELIFNSSRNYFSSKNPITKIINNTLEKNKNWFKFKIPQSLEDIFEITQEWTKYHIKSLLFYFFSIEKYKKIISKNLNSSLDILIKNIKKKSIKKKTINDIRLFFILLCSIFLNSDKEKQFIEGLKSREINNFFDSFPRLIDYFGFSSSMMSPFSKYDGTLIDKSINLNSFDKILNRLKKYDFISVNEKEAIYNFLNKELNDFSRKDRNLKWIKKLNRIEFSILFLTIEINTQDWETYLEYLKNINIKLAKWYINVRPPYQISQRLDYLLDEFDKKNDKKIFEEILLITKIKFVLKRYSIYILVSDKEINFLLEQVREKKLNFELKTKTKKLLNQIFSKQFSWLKDIDYEEYLEKLEKRETPKRLDELLFIYAFVKDKKIYYERIDLLIKLMKEDLKNEKLLEGQIIFDYFIRILKFNIQKLKENSQKIHYFIILINEIKNINDEVKNSWINHLKSLLIYYELFECWEIKHEEWNKITILTSDIIRALLYYQVTKEKDNLFKIQDQKIANYLDHKAYDDKVLEVFNELFYLKKNIKHLGQKTLKFFNEVFEDYKKNDRENYQYLKTNEKFISIKKEIEKYLKK